MINFIDTMDIQIHEVSTYSNLCDLDLNLYKNTCSITDDDFTPENDVSIELLNQEIDSIPQIQKRIERRRPPKKAQYTYHKKKKRPAPKPLIHLKENGLKLCLVLEKPKSNAHPFSLDEDKKILHLVLKLGPKFQKIAKSFPGKSVSMVKNRYYKHLRYQWDAVLGSEYQHLNVPKPEDSSTSGSLGCESMTIEGLPLEEMLLK